MIKKKKNHVPSEKQATPISNPPNTWPNLPHQLIAQIAIHLNLMENITSFGCVIKTWRSTSRQCIANGKYPKQPQLVEIIITGKKRGEKNQERGRSHTIDIPFHDKYPYPYYYKKRKSPKNNFCSHPMYFKGHSHGHVVVVLNEGPSNFCLWEPAKTSALGLLGWNTNFPFRTCTLSSSPYDIDGFSAMVITGIDSPAFAFSGWGKSITERVFWSFQDCCVEEPYNPGENMRFTNAIGFKGKFYALTLQGSVVVIEGDVDSCFRIAAVGSRRSVPIGVSRQFREYLVELDGEILLVFLVSRKCIDVVDDVEVFRLDIDRVLWAKIESIGDRALFLEDECCMWVDAKKLGCKKNCIYFTHHRVNEWLTFDLGSGEISPAFGQDYVTWDIGRLNN
ncbi:PREDICTED: uncharacterized protein LOC105956054 [Erythranthe guttata]|uniref:uncharacterized protein LOC105956054 n=1 Tax=Erythranthe guttata TaxID=4155 RepID=UPI00064DC4D1|nr:PREDICTED: uncharacterized protein LOC105956054 [Erythranthe guttata]|eukprot:XP_012835330.1 PREDICTED: uncharacterized protein LOC105956054 [Erythranthe guttata]